MREENTSRTEAAGSEPCYLEGAAFHHCRAGNDKLQTMAELRVSIIFPIIGGMKANNGEVWKYPMAFTFLK